MKISRVLWKALEEKEDLNEERGTSNYEWVTVYIFGKYTIEIHEKAEKLLVGYYVKEATEHERWKRACECLEERAVDSRDGE